MRASRLTRTAPQERSTYARTALDFLVNDPLGFPSNYPPGVGGDPPLWWLGLDSGGGAYPIGPNGPYASTGVAAVPAVIRATALITGPITSAPFRVTTGAGEVREAPRWLVDPMLVRPDARFPGPEQPEVMQLPRAAFWTEFVRSAIWWGLGAFVCTEDHEGQPLAGSLRMVDSRQLSTVRDPDSDEWLWVLGGGGEEATFDRGGRISFPLTTGGTATYRLVVLRNPHSPVGPEGNSLGVFALSPKVYSLASQIDSYAAGTFRSGIPAGYLKVQTPGLTQEAATALRERWLGAHGGDRRSIAVLNATTEFQPLNLSPVDTALDQVKRLNLADVAFSFGLDPMTLGVGLQNSATYNNVRDAWANHRDFGLAPYTAAVEDCLSSLLPGNGAVRVNLDGFANPTPAERFTAYEVALRAGILTLDEVRAIEHLPPIAAPPEPPEPEPPSPAPIPEPEEVETDG